LGVGQVGREAFDPARCREIEFSLTRSVRHLR